MSSIAKVIEVIAQSERSFDHAVEEALKEASKSVENIQELWVGSFKAIVNNNRIVKYRVTTRVTFLVKGHDACRSGGSSGAFPARGRRGTRA